MTLEEFDWVMAVNFRSVVRLTHALLPALKAHPGGIKTRIAESARTGSGVSVEEYEQGRKQFAKLLTMPPEAAAAQIMTAIERRRPRLLIGWSATVPDVLVRLLPGSYWKLIARRAGTPAPRAT